MKGAVTCPPGSNATAAMGCQPYDEAGAMMYTVAILCMFALGIALLIGAQVSRNPHDTKLSQYMKQMELVRESIRYKRLLGGKSRSDSVMATTSPKKRRKSHPFGTSRRPNGRNRDASIE